MLRPGPAVRLTTLLREVSTGDQAPGTSLQAQNLLLTAMWVGRNEWAMQNPAYFSGPRACSPVVRLPALDSKVWQATRASLPASCRTIYHSAQSCASSAPLAFAWPSAVQGSACRQCGQNTQVQQ